jgi:hypothetical protein
MGGHKKVGPSANVDHVATTDADHATPFWGKRGFLQVPTTFKRSENIGFDPARNKKLHALPAIPNNAHTLASGLRIGIDF